MCHEILEVIAGDQERILFVPAPDLIARDDYIHCINADSRWGELRHIEFRHGEIKMWLHRYRVCKNTPLRIRFPGQSCLSLSYTLGEDVPYEIQGNYKGLSRHGSYNMIYQREIEVTLYLEKDKDYILMGINFLQEYLNSPDMPDKIVDFVSEINNSKTLLLDSNEFDIENKMRLSIDLITGLLMNGTIKWNYQLSNAIQKLCKRSFKKANAAYTNEKEETVIFRKMVKYIDNHLSEVTIESLKREFGYREDDSETARLRKFFQKHATMNTSDFITDRKMTKALELVTNTDRQMKSIASDVGYQTGSAFSAAFHARYSMYPKECRIHNKMKGEQQNPNQPE